MNSQRVSLQELNSQAESNAPINASKSVNQSQSDSNLQKLKKKSKNLNYYLKSKTNFPDDNFFDSLMASSQMATRNKSCLSIHLLYRATSTD